MVRVFCLAISEAHFYIFTQIRENVHKGSTYRPEVNSTVNNAFKVFKWSIGVNFSQQFHLRNGS